MIYVSRGHNPGLEEIRDQKLIQKAKTYMNINDMIDNYAPVICGSVVNGGFKRKL